MKKFISDVPVKGIMHLFLVRGSIYLFPFITLPIITHSLGVSQFGVLSVFLAAQQYLIMLVEYGFTLTGSRDIARGKDNNDKIVTEIMVCRALISAGCGLIIFSVYFFKGFNAYSDCFIILFITVMSAIFNQTHYFIGKEKTGFIVISSAITRVISILFVILFVKSKDDLIIAMAAYSLNVALPNILSSVYLLCGDGFFNKKSISFAGIVTRFKSGFDIFISNVFTNIYSSLTLIYLSNAKGAAETGYYSSADKLKAAAQGVLSPIAQAFFPRISKNSGWEFFKIWKKSSLILISFAIILVAVLITFSKQVYNIFLGSQFINGINAYYLLIFSIISISFGIAFAQNLYLVSGKTKLLRKIYFTVSVLHLIHMPILIHYFGATGAAMSVLITESFASLLMFWFRKTCYTWSEN